MLPRHTIACILVFFPLNSFNSSRGSCYFCYARLHLVRPQYHNRFVRRWRRTPHLYYWSLPRPCNSWFEIHFQRRNIWRASNWNIPTKNRDQIFLIDIFLQIMTSKLTNLSDFTPDKNLASLKFGKPWQNLVDFKFTGRTCLRELVTDFFAK